MLDFDGANRARDRRLRKRLLNALYLSRSSPTGFIGGRTLMDVIGAEGLNSQVFEDDAHFLSLCRDLTNKGLAVSKMEIRRRGQAFGPDYVSFAITDKGTSLWLETIPADPDIDDERIVEGQ
jgi:hypothetical protein